MSAYTVQKLLGPKCIDNGGFDLQRFVSLQTVL